MTQNDEIEDLETTETPQEETKPAPATAEAMQGLVDTVAALKAEIGELRKPKEPVAPATPPAQMPTEYNAADIDAIVQARMAEALRPVADQVAANEQERNLALRDGMIDQISGLTDESRMELQAVAQKQFESGAAANFKEAIANARAILGITQPKQTQATQDARRAGRRGGTSRPPQETAEKSEDDVLDAIFAEHELPS